MPQHDPWALSAIAKGAIATLSAVWLMLISLISWVWCDHRKRHDALRVDVDDLRDEKASREEITEIKTLIEGGITAAEIRDQRRTETVREQIIAVHNKIEEGQREVRASVEATNKAVLSLAMHDKSGD